MKFCNSVLLVGELCNHWKTTKVEGPWGDTPMMRQRPHQQGSTQPLWIFQQNLCNQFWIYLDSFWINLDRFWINLGKSSSESDRQTQKWSETNPVLKNDLFCSEIVMKFRTKNCFSDPPNFCSTSDKKVFFSW